MIVLLYRKANDPTILLSPPDRVDPPNTSSCIPKPSDLEAVFEEEDIIVSSGDGSSVWSSQHPRGCKTNHSPLFLAINSCLNFWIIVHFLMFANCWMKRKKDAILQITSWRKNRRRLSFENVPPALFLFKK